MKDRPTLTDILIEMQDVRDHLHPDDDAWRFCLNRWIDLLSHLPEVERNVLDDE